MDPTEDPPQKDYGPQSSLLTRRVWGGICIAAVLAFLGAVVAVSGDGSRCESCTSFGANGENEALPAWLLVLGAIAVVGVSLTAPLLGRIRVRAERGGEDA